MKPHQHEMAGDERLCFIRALGRGPQGGSRTVEDDRPQPRKADRCLKLCKERHVGVTFEIGSQGALHRVSCDEDRSSGRIFDEGRSCRWEILLDGDDAFDTQVA